MTDGRRAALPLNLRVGGSHNPKIWGTPWPGAWGWLRVGSGNRVAGRPELAGDAKCISEVQNAICSARPTAMPTAHPPKMSEVK